MSDILLEVNIGREESKSGIMPEDAAALCQKLQGYKGINLRGLMAIPPVSESGQCRRYFSDMRELFYVIKKNAPAGFDILSIGMSDDFEIAVEEGRDDGQNRQGIFGEGVDGGRKWGKRPKTPALYVKTAGAGSSRYKREYRNHCPFASAQSIWTLNRATGTAVAARVMDAVRVAYKSGKGCQIIHKCRKCGHISKILRQRIQFCRTT